MAGSNGWIEYGERMERVSAYVFDHLDDDLDLNKLAEVACLSPYHWHRIYHAMRGETIAATVRRLRLHRATALKLDLPAGQRERAQSPDAIGK